MKTEVHAELPQDLLARAKELVESGWAADLNELLADALRRYVESHSSALNERFVREDVRWGLHGEE